MHSIRLLAYLDPGSGSLILQVIIGGILAGTVALRSFIGKAFANIKKLFSRGKKDTPEDEDE